MRSRGLVGCLVAVLAAAVAAGDVDTVMPYSLSACGGEPAAIAERLRVMKERSGISRYVLSGPSHVVRVTGMLDEAGYAALGKKVRAIAELVRKDGIEVGYLMMPTMNCGINHPWRHYVRKDGAERAFTPCPADEGFRAAFAAKCAAVAREGRPFLYMMEDDFRYFFEGCFCEEHRRRLAAGEERHAMYMKDLKAIAAAAERAIHAVSPETRVGLCAPGGFPLEDTDLLARILAGGKHRPYVRYYGAIYGNDTPIDLAGVLSAAQMARETLPPDVEYVYESDPVPHSRFYASAARVGALVSWTAAMGYDGAYYWGLGSAFDALETSPDYLDLHRRDYPRWTAIRKVAKEGTSVGVTSGGSAWTWVLNRMGVPNVMRPTKVRLFSGDGAFAGWSDEKIKALLAGGVFIDGAAAEELTRRGYADLIGVKATKREKVDFSGERSADGKVKFGCSFHQNYGLDGCPVSRFASAGAETLAYFFAGVPTNRVQPSVTFFENKLGGRVAALAVNLGGCVSPNVFSFAKRDLIVSTLKRLGADDQMPARVLDRVNVALHANEDAAKSRLFLHLVNLSCDPFGSAVFDVAAPYAGGAVEILDGAAWRPLSAAWKDGRLTVAADVAVYGTLVLRISRK